MDEFEGQRQASARSSAALAASLAFAMEQEGFDQKECERYKALGFKSDNKTVLRSCLDWMAKNGGASSDQVEAWVVEAFYAQRPEALAALAEVFPKAIELECSGLDVWGSGLAMALATGKDQAAVALSKALALIDSDGAKFRKASRAALDIGAHPPIGGYYETPPAGMGQIQAALARCEQAVLSMAAKAAPARKGVSSI